MKKKKTESNWKKVSLLELHNFINFRLNHSMICCFGVINTSEQVFQLT